jgi:hypothetical protein
MSVYEFVHKLFDGLEDKSYKERYHERSAFDIASRATLTVLMENAIGERPNQFALIWLAKLTRISKRQTGTRLRHQARYGLITVQYQYRKDGSGLNDSNIITVNPILLGIYTTGSQAKTLQSFIDHYFKMGYKRLEIDNKDVQGFDSDVEYGYIEPESEHLQDANWLKRLMTIVNANDVNKVEKKADKKREYLLWLGLSNEFIAASGRLWTKAQGEMGYGYNSAVWDGEVSTLGSTPKRERTELVKLFQSHGGFKTAVAWYIFVCGIPQKDSKGRLQFDLRAPHRQFVTIDKKPSQFAKHFNAILSDEIFVEFTTKSSDEISSTLKVWYNDLLNVNPRYDQFNGLL